LGHPCARRHHGPDKNYQSLLSGSRALGRVGPRGSSTSCTLMRGRGLLSADALPTGAALWPRMSLSSLVTLVASGLACRPRSRTGAVSESLARADAPALGGCTTFRALPLVAFWLLSNGGVSVTGGKDRRGGAGGGLAGSSSAGMAATRSCFGCTWLCFSARWRSPAMSAAS
jgi:hypothetical protein